jgi:hypothetical protein
VRRRDDGVLAPFRDVRPDANVLGMGDRVELTRYAIRVGLVEP